MLLCNIPKTKIDDAGILEKNRYTNSLRILIMIEY